MRSKLVRYACSALFGIGAIWTRAAHGRPAEDFYAGKTVFIIVSTAAGGGYDALARTVARYLPRHIPGDPAVVVQDMPGAAGIVAMNYLYNSAPKDGTTFGSVQNDTPFEPLFGAKEARYDATKFNWLGTPSTETDVLAAWRATAAHSLADLRKTEFTVGSTGTNSNPSLWANILSSTLGLKIKTVGGYPGQDDILLGMERGEVNGTFIFYNSLMTARSGWVVDKDVRLLVQIGDGKDPRLAGTPFAPDLAANAEDKLLIEEAAAPLSVGRPYVMPPGAPADRVAIMRRAMIDTFRDPAFDADVEKMRMEANAIRTGAQIQGIIARAYATPQRVTARLRKILNP